MSGDNDLTNIFTKIDEIGNKLDEIVTQESILPEKELKELILANKKIFQMDRIDKYGRETSKGDNAQEYFQGIRGVIICDTNNRDWEPGQEDDTELFLLNTGELKIAHLHYVENIDSYYFNREFIDGNILDYFTPNDIIKGMIYTAKEKLGNMNHKISKHLENMYQIILLEKASTILRLNDFLDNVSDSKYEKIIKEIMTREEII